MYEKKARRKELYLICAFLANKIYYKFERVQSQFTWKQHLTSFKIDALKLQGMKATSVWWYDQTQHITSQTVRLFEVNITSNMVFPCVVEEVVWYMTDGKISLTIRKKVAFLSLHTSILRSPINISPSMGYSDSFRKWLSNWSKEQEGALYTIITVQVLKFLSLYKVTIIASNLFVDMLWTHTTLRCLRT